MLVKILIVVAVLAVAFVALVASRPSQCSTTRSAYIAAPPSAIFPLVNDFHNWEAWSPWAKLDPKAKTSYSGAAAGEGASFAWDGNKNVGTGTMTIVESRPSELIRIKLDFLKPFAGTSAAQFTFKPTGNGTTVTWSMTGKANFMAKAVNLFMNMDKMVGGQFEKGLASMKQEAEATAAIRN